MNLQAYVPVRPYSYRAFIKIGDEYHWAEETKSFGTFQEIEHICPDENHPHVIDLELPSGTKWLCSNVGAISPNGYGRYYAWGETYEKGSYVRSSHFGSAVISDNHDVAYVQSGGEYRMPSRSQIQELMSECSWEWQSHDGVMGAMVTRKGHSIFLPASSFRDDEVPGPAKGLYGSYWGRDFGGVRQWGSNNVLCGTELIFGLLDGNAGFTPSNFYYTYGNTGWVYCGRSVRAVVPQTVEPYEIGIQTLDAANVGSESATINVSCTGWEQYGAKCGVEYWSNANNHLYKSVTPDETNSEVDAATGTNRTMRIELNHLNPDTEYNYRTYIDMEGAYIYSDEIKTFRTEPGTASVVSLCPDDNHPHMVDLGLPSGLKWACCNVGASAPVDYGGYYAWGELDDDTECSWASYKYGSDENDCIRIATNISGTSYDVARVKWGSPWRMPTYADVKELKDYTIAEWVVQDGMGGRKFTGNNGNAIFLPAAGNRSDGVMNVVGEYGDYWIANERTAYPGHAYGLYFSETRMGTWRYLRYLGRSVRPISE